MDSLNIALAELRNDFERCIRDFSMEYIELDGFRSGPMAEWETRLSIRGHGNAKLFLRRSPGDSALIFPGRYSGRLSDAALLDFFDVLDASGVQAYRSEAPGPRDPVSRLNLSIRSKLYRYSWGVSKQSVPPQMAKLKDRLTQWTFDACPSVEWNLVLSVDSVRCEGNAWSARLKLENMGTQAIHILHPASPDLASSFGLSLEYGEAQSIEEGYTPEPIDLKRISLLPQKLPRAEFVELLPGHAFDLDMSAHLEGSAPRGWIGNIFFSHYLSQDVLAGLPVFNGALISKELTW